MTSELRTWLAKWDNKIQDWNKNPAADNISELFPGNEFDFYALPEPYIGNPNRCSAVILNMNPGGTMPDQCWQKGSFITERMATDSYSSFAMKFPYLNSPYEGTPGGKFWKLREKWISRFLNVEATENGLYPFAMEICPWHSKKWSAPSSYEKYDLLKYLHENLITIAEEVALNSTLGIVLCIGADYRNIFNSFNKLKDNNLSKFTKIKSISYEYFDKDCPPFPKNKKNSLVCRNYELFKSQSLHGTLFLNTWAPGGNMPPSESFSDVEKYILKLSNF